MFAKSAQRLGYIVIIQNTHVQSVKRIIAPIGVQGKSP